MLFNSVDFAIFCPIVFFLYWGLCSKSASSQNLLIVFASFLFYGWWDWRFLSLLMVSGLVDYLVALGMREGTPRKRTALLMISLACNLGLLGYFKYADFFLSSFIDAFRVFGFSFSPRSLNVVLPVGISFYTFQSLSYSIDVYRRDVPATADVVKFFAFLSFFPQLVAGPIERAANLLPQMSQKRQFNVAWARDGLRQILWGLVKKVVVAGNCGVVVDRVFVTYENQPGSMLIIALCLFSIQIYGDFSGYSDIAIGTAKLFGVDLMRNFNYPFFSEGFREFWRKWHISLVTWFKDYVYIPLGGNKRSTATTIRNIFIVFLISALWHGANWTFVIWGIVNAIYFAMDFIFRRDFLTKGSGYLASFLRSVAVFVAISATWVFFRSPTATDALKYLRRIVTAPFGAPEGFLLPLCLSCLLILIEWFNRKREYGIKGIVYFPRAFRWVTYLTMIGLMAILSRGQQEFIYFQF